MPSDELRPKEKPELSDNNELAPTPTHNVGDVEDLEGYETKTNVDDEVFGEITERGPNYRALGWIGTAILMMKTQIGLGVLSIPIVFHDLGMALGVVCLISIAIITTWSNYMIGKFKENHPDVYGIDDVGGKIFGPVGRWFLTGTFILYWVFVSGSGMLGISISLNALSSNNACTAVFVAVAFIIAFLCSSIRTLGKISWVAWIGLLCILVSIFTLTIVVAIQGHPADADDTIPWVSDWSKGPTGETYGILAALATLVFAYSGTPAFFSIVSEMKERKHYTRSLIICQSVVTITYLVIGVVVYYYAGSFVSSPALGTAGPLFKKICYGIALLGLVATTTIVTHVPAKFIFVKMGRGKSWLNNGGLKHWSIWLSCTFGVSLVAYVIASAIPVFGNLVSLIGALLGTMMSFQPMGCMWLYDNWNVEPSQRTPRWRLMVAYSVFVIVAGTFLMIAGTYGSVQKIIADSANQSSPWSCADNSSS